MFRSNSLLWRKLRWIWSYGVAVLSVAAALTVSRLPPIHFGRLWAASNSPRGVSFCFALPANTEVTE
jgi:hypothetical protein